MRLVLARFALLALILALPAPALAQWSDDFDSYAAGSGIIGQGDWEGWDGSVVPDALVSNAVSLSAPNALECGPDTDIVQQFSGVSANEWVFSTWQYIPGNTTGETYFILLNTYTPDGNPDENWSVQVNFGNGLVTSEFEANALPIMFDQWVEIRVEIDFTADSQAIYYGGALLSMKSWTEGVSGGGALNLAAVDLFGNGASPVYYDDFTLERVGSTPVEVETWGGIKERFGR